MSTKTDEGCAADTTAGYHTSAVPRCTAFLRNGIIPLTERDNPRFFLPSRNVAPKNTPLAGIVFFRRLFRRVPRSMQKMRYEVRSAARVRARYSGSVQPCSSCSTTSGSSAPILVRSATGVPSSAVVTASA